MRNYSDEKEIHVELNIYLNIHNYQLNDILMLKNFEKDFV
jgi:hypothetical protein